MGFYDEMPRKPRRSSSAAKWIAVIVVSALAGSGTTIAIMPTLVQKEINRQMPANQTTEGSYKPSSPAQNISYQVSNDSIISAVNKVKPAVVGVVNLQKYTNPFSMSKQEQMAGSGSGVLIDSNGDIVTNNHVVQDATDVQVVIQDEKVQAKVIGTDPTTDLAVVRVSDLSKIKNIAPAQFGDSDKLQIGEPAIAIGNPLGLSLNQTVTVGVISALRRDIPVGNGLTETYLQTDAAINPGNSGGALVNIAGQVIGINAAKISSAGIEGIGFAIPINTAQPIVRQLIQSGKVIRAALGIYPVDIVDLPTNYQQAIPTNQGVYVQKVTAEAQNQGIKAGDVITKLDGQTVKDSSDLRKIIYSHKPGDTVQVTLLRIRDEKSVTIKLQQQSQQ